MVPSTPSLPSDSPATTLPSTPPTTPVVPGTNVVLSGACCPVKRIPGVTALEYLGAGYNIFEGNPRGSLSSELDPGFCNGVVNLIVDPSMATLNREFVVPLGTEHRATTSCQFSSSSTEISSTNEYQKELSREAMVTRQTSASGNILGFKFGVDSFYSRSDNFQSFAMQRLQTQTTSYQSRALCTEFEARLQKFYEHTLQDAFRRGLDSLLSTFDSGNEEHKALFGDFLDEYGTHYVNYVALGAKQVYSLEMKSLDIMELRSMEIEVSTSTSSKTMFGFERSAQVEGSGKVKGVDVKVSTEIRVQAELSTSESMTETVSEKEMELNEIRQRTQRVVETNVGGTPPSDGQWQTWAATARERPMPILYELSELT